MSNQNSPAQTRRLILIVTSLMDAVISGLVLLIYFGVLPIDLSSWGISRWLIGGVWFLVSICILAYQLTKPDMDEQS